MAKDDVELVGWGHTPFGNLADESAESLAGAAAGEALSRAGISAGDIDAVVIGSHGGSMRSASGASFTPPNGPDGAGRFPPHVRFENACTTGAAAILCGLQALRSGAARRVLVVGVEKMTSPGTGRVDPAVVAFRDLFAGVTQAYFERYGDHRDALATIAAKNHRNGVANPYAHLRSDLGFDFCSRVGTHNPLVADPLRRTDCAPISDGAAAVVLAAPGDAPRGPAVRIRAMVETNDDPVPARRDPLALPAAHTAWQSVLERAGVRMSDLHLVEVHDCFTVAELLAYEVLGLCGPGGGAQVVADGVVDRNGALPVNPSGGLKAMGHPIGATGVSQHVMVTLQLTGEAGAMQAPGAAIGGAMAMGGFNAANYASILERVR